MTFWLDAFRVRVQNLYSNVLWPKGQDIVKNLLNVCKTFDEDDDDVDDEGVTIVCWVVSVDAWYKLVPTSDEKIIYIILN